MTKLSVLLFYLVLIQIFDDDKFMTHQKQLQLIIFMIFTKQLLSHYATKVPVQKRIRLGRPGTSLKMGLLGMANIGKSSTFNLLSNLNVPAENIPFCTIDPNNALVEVHDQKFEQLCKLYNPAKRNGKVLRILDIAGLVKGASQGFGLGNEFLSHVMQVDGLYHVVRAFPGQFVAHTEGGMDAIRDIKIIKNELIMKDRDILAKKLNEYEKKAAKTQDKNIKAEYDVLKKVDDSFKKGMEIRNLLWDASQIEILNKYLFLTSKPMIYLINTSKELFLQDKIPNFDQIVDLVTEGGKFQTQVIKYSVEHEQNIEKGEKSKVKEIIAASYEELQLCHFYTVGKDEVRAWAVRTGENAQEAGGKIHSDFKKTFINAEVMHCDTLLANPEHASKLQKHSRKEGKTYIVKQGDILHFNCKVK